jgi:hypothetical protein
MIDWLIDWLIIYCFTSRSRIFLLYGDVFTFSFTLNRENFFLKKNEVSCIRQCLVYFLSYFEHNKQFDNKVAQYAKQINIQNEKFFLFIEVVGFSIQNCTKRVVKPAMFNTQVTYIARMSCLNLSNFSFSSTRRSISTKLVIK